MQLTDLFFCSQGGLRCRGGPDSWPQAAGGFTSLARLGILTQVVRALQANTNLPEADDTDEAQLSWQSNCNFLMFAS